MNTYNKRLLPYRSVNESDIVNEYALDRTGDYGMFVKVSRGDSNDIQGQVAASYGASFDRVTSPRWGVKNEITPTVSGDDKWDLLGVTLFNTYEVDENGIPLKFYRQKLTELHAVLSGHACPVATRGRFTLGVDACTVTGGALGTGAGQGFPSPGWVGCISDFAAGELDFVPTSRVNTTGGSAGNTEGYYTNEQVVAKVLATGQELGGSVYIQLGV